MIRVHKKKYDHRFLQYLSKLAQLTGKCLFRHDHTHILTITQRFFLPNWQQLTLLIRIATTVTFDDC